MIWKVPCVSPVNKRGQGQTWLDHGSGPLPGNTRTPAPRAAAAAVLGDVDRSTQPSILLCLTRVSPVVLPTGAASLDPHVPDRGLPTCEFSRLLGCRSEGFGGLRWEGPPDLRAGLRSAS